MKLRYTPRAAAALTEKILGYIEDRSPQGARHVQARIHAIISLLSQHPHAGQRTSNDRLRRTVAAPLIFYEVTETKSPSTVCATRRRPSTPE